MENGKLTIATSNESFFSGWFAGLEDLMLEFKSAEQRIHDGSNEDDSVFKDLIARARAHYKQYLVEKWRIGQRQILLLFSPPWLSRLERALLWIAGFKPSLLFELVSQSVHDLSPDQSDRMKRAADETRLDERALNDELAKFHESVGAPPVVGLARNLITLVDGQIVEEAVAMEKMRSAAEALVTNADLLSANVWMKVVGILSPAQSVRVFAALMQMQLRIRNLGMQRDGERD